MLSYANEIIEFEGCPGCAYANHEFFLPCGMAYEDGDVNLSQDWELPIPGFMVISPNRHASKVSEIDEDVLRKMNDIAHDVIKILEENNICDGFNLISEEKPNRHYHIWIMPRHKWMIEKFKDIMANIGPIFDYAKNNLRTEEIYMQILEISNLLKEELAKKYNNEFHLTKKHN